MEIKLPIKCCGGGFITDGNFEPLLFTESQANAHIKKLIACKNRQYKRINPNSKFKYKLLDVTNRGEYFTYSSC